MFILKQRPAVEQPQKLLTRDEAFLLAMNFAKLPKGVARYLEGHSAGRQIRPAAKIEYERRSPGMKETGN